VKDIEVDPILYISLIKTIRGVLSLISKPKDYVLKWLRRSIRWRPIGAGLSTIRLLKQYGFSSKTIKPQPFPCSELKEITNLISAHGLDKVIAEAIVLASTYIVPVIILDEAVLDKLRKTNSVTYEILSQKELKDKDIKLHMRISEYSIKDYHIDVISRIERAIEENKLEEELKWREKLCIKDSKRYWRIKQNRGKTLIVYIDILRALKDEYASLSKITGKSRYSLLGLGIPIGLIIPAMLK